MLAYSRAGGGTFLRAFSNAMRENPVPSLLIGAGCMMLLSEKMGLRPGAWGNGGRQMMAIADDPYGASAGRSRVSEAAGRVSDAAGRVSDAAGRVLYAAGRTTEFGRLERALGRRVRRVQSRERSRGGQPPDLRRRRHDGGHDETERGDGRRHGRARGRRRSRHGARHARFRRGCCRADAARRAERGGRNEGDGGLDGRRGGSGARHGGFDARNGRFDERPDRRHGGPDAPPGDGCDETRARERSLVHLRAASSLRGDRGGGRRRYRQHAALDRDGRPIDGRDERRGEGRGRTGRNPTRSRARRTSPTRSRTGRSRR